MGRMKFLLSKEEDTSPMEGLCLRAGVFSKESIWKAKETE